MKHKLPGIYQLILVLVASVPLFHVVQAKQPDRSPGAYIPVLKNTHTDELTATRWIENAAGAQLQVSSGAAEAWDALDQALTSLGIKPLKKDTESRQWLTGWVVWSYDKKTASGRSKPGFSFASRNLERHYFLFTVEQGKHHKQAIITALDNTRQQEVDINPDSAYAWLEWTEQEPQQDAADSFLQRLQLPIESALATDFIAREEIIVTTAGDIVVAETAVDANADVVLITLPATGETTVPENISLAEDSPASAPQLVDKIPQKQGAAEPKTAASTESIVKSPEMGIKQPLSIPVDETSPPQPLDQSTLEEPVSVPLTPAVSVAPPQTESPVHSQSPTETPASNGLLVRAVPALAWPALLQALADLDIPIETRGGQQYLLDTGWMNANYDEQNHQLVLRSKQGPKWAFSLLDDKGEERHKFRIEMLSASQGTRSIIHAYHIASQEQVDLTPDSSQTVLSWEDRQTSADVALALLRKLRIIIAH